jgi:hypothetical protein
MLIRQEPWELPCLFLMPHTGAGTARGHNNVILPKKRSQVVMSTTTPHQQSATANDAVDALPAGVTRVTNREWRLKNAKTAEKVPQLRLKNKSKKATTRGKVSQLSISAKNAKKARKARAVEAAKVAEAVAAVKAVQVAKAVEVAKAAKAVEAAQAAEAAKVARAVKAAEAAKVAKAVDAARAAKAVPGLTMDLRLSVRLHECLKTFDSKLLPMDIGQFFDTFMCRAGMDSDRDLDARQSEFGSLLRWMSAMEREGHLVLKRPIGKKKKALPVQIKAIGCKQSRPGAKRIQLTSSALRSLESSHILEPFGNPRTGQCSPSARGNQAEDDPSSQHDDDHGSCGSMSAASGTMITVSTSDSVATSQFTVHATAHCAERQHTRGVNHRELQSAMKHGRKVRTRSHHRIHYGGVTAIANGKTVITTWRTDSEVREVRTTRNKQHCMAVQPAPAYVSKRGYEKAWGKQNKSKSIRCPVRLHQAGAAKSKTGTSKKPAPAWWHGQMAALAIKCRHIASRGGDWDSWDDEHGKGSLGGIR